MKRPMRNEAVFAGGGDLIRGLIMEMAPGYLALGLLNRGMSSPGKHVLNLVDQRSPVSTSSSIFAPNIGSMKAVQGLASLALAALVVASPTPSLSKRAAAEDPCDIGYCTQNGGCV